MRKSFDALLGLVRNELQRNLTSGELNFTAPRVQAGSGVVKRPEFVPIIEGIQVKSSTQKVRYQL